MVAKIKSDIVIIGSGVSGLWTHMHLSNQGYEVLSIDQSEVGGTQTMASQGMIHGGQRYTLLGQETDHSRRISEMPPRWERYLSAQEPPFNLEKVHILSDHQYMWTPGSLLSKVTGFLASKVMNSSVKKLSKTSWPKVFQEQEKFSGNVYRMSEKVLDSESLARELKNNSKGSFKRASLVSVDMDNGRVKSINVDIGNDVECEIEASAYIFTAGTGNEIACQAMFKDVQKTQRRPLRQLLVKGPSEHFYGHCIGTDDRPRATISSYNSTDDGGKTKVWYIGGKVAEDVLNMSEGEAFCYAARELSQLFPQYSFNEFEWALFDVDRAEPKASSGFFHSSPELIGCDNAAIMWPMKLTYAPVVGDKLCDWVSERDLSKGVSEGWEKLQNNTVKSLPWNDMKWKKL